MARSNAPIESLGQQLAPRQCAGGSTGQESRPTGPPAESSHPVEVPTLVAQPCPPSSHRRNSSSQAHSVEQSRLAWVPFALPKRRKVFHDGLGTVERSGQIQQDLDDGGQMLLDLDGLMPPRPWQQQVCLGSQEAANPKVEPATDEEARPADVPAMEVTGFEGVPTRVTMGAPAAFLTKLFRPILTELWQFDPRGGEAVASAWVTDGGRIQMCMQSAGVRDGAVRALDGLTLFGRQLQVLALPREVAEVFA